jgi:hypothetical protein
MIGEAAGSTSTSRQDDRMKSWGKCWPPTAAEQARGETDVEKWNTKGTGEWNDERAALQ